MKCDRLQSAAKKKKKKTVSEWAETRFNAKTSRAAVIKMKCILLDKLHSQQNDDRIRKLFYHQNFHWVNRRAARMTWVVFGVHAPRQL